MKATIADEILERLNGFADALQKTKNLADLQAVFGFRQVVVDFSPLTYSAEAVKDVRQLLGVSQAVFSRLLGVSIRTVQAWERGTNQPKEMACRWLDEIKRNPAYWLERIRQAVVQKQPRKRDVAEV